MQAGHGGAKTDAGGTTGTRRAVALYAGMAFLLRKSSDAAETGLVLSPAEAAVRAALARPRRERRP